MGWIDYTYKGGRRLIWHTGFYDGFGAFIGFFPEEDLGLAVITNMAVGSSNFFYKYGLNLLLSETFGINRGLNERVIAGYQDATKSPADMAAKSVAADAGAIAPFLGYYQRGYRLAFDAAGVLRLYLTPLPIGFGECPTATMSWQPASPPGRSSVWRATESASRK